MPDDIITETVRFAVDVKIRYTNGVDRDCCVDSATRDLRRSISLMGAGPGGRYSIESIGAKAMPGAEPS